MILTFVPENNHHRFVLVSPLPKRKCFSNGRKWPLWRICCHPPGLVLGKGHVMVSVSISLSLSLCVYKLEAPCRKVLPSSSFLSCLRTSTESWATRCSMTYCGRKEGRSVPSPCSQKLSLLLEVCASQIVWSRELQTESDFRLENTQ